MSKEKIKKVDAGVSESHNDLSSVLATRLAHASTNPDVQERFIRERVEQEVNKRATALSQLDAKIAKVSRDLNRCKADVTHYAENGDEAGSYWSKKALDDKKRLTEELERYTKAFNKALSTGDYSDVYKHTANEKVKATEAGNDEGH